MNMERGVGVGCSVWGMISRYKEQGPVISPQDIYGMQLFLPALDTCFWTNTPDIKIGPQ